MKVLFSPVSKSASAEHGGSQALTKIASFISRYDDTSRGITIVKRENLITDFYEVEYLYR
jgi:hypothetical protein